MAGVITGSIINAAAGLFGAKTQADATQNAANTQANAALTQQANLLAAGQTASQQFTPYSGAGTTALSNLASNNAYFNNQFSNQDLNAQMAPNYAFQLQQGQQGQNQANNATGGLVGGNAQQALSTFNQNYAQNAYQNAFNNYQTQRANIAGQNMNQTQLGLAGATGSANAQLGTATNVAQLGIGSANAQAASQIAQGSIYGNAANSLGNIAYMGAQTYGQSNPYSNPYSNMGLSGSNSAGFTYNTQVGPTPSGGNLSNYTPD